MFKKITLILLVSVFGILLISQIGCKKDEEEQQPDPTPPTYTNGEGEIGSIGGTIKITDQNSPIIGTYIIIPEGALNQNTNIIISKGNYDELMYPEDTTAIFVKFEPKGLQFNKPVEIGIPYTISNNELNELKVYFVDSDSTSIEELPLESINQTDKIAIATTNHFSTFYAGRRFVYMDIDLFQNNGKISTRLNVFSQRYGQTWRMDNILLLAMWYPFSIYDAKDAIFWDSQDEVFSTFAVELHAKKFGPWNDFIEREYFTIRRDYNTTGKHGIKIYADYYDLSNMIYQYDEIEDDVSYEKCFQGYPLVFSFDHNPDPEYEYYVKVEWCLSVTPQALFGSRYTPLDKVNTYDKPIRFNEMSTYNGDQNSNRIDDNYENGGNSNEPPNEPSNPSPVDYTTGVSMNTNISWSCSDPDGDDLDYDIYFGTNQDPPIVETFYSSPTYNPGTLNENETYYWYIIAYDDHENSTEGPVWQFTTGDSGGNPGEPCPGIPTVNYEGQVYNTLQIGTQCWLKENLNVGIMIQGENEMENNGTIEKYCYDNEPANCETYGGLYQWDEMMQYDATEGSQGICPAGWHVPTDEEWKQLEGEVDSQFEYPNPEWDGVGFRGFNVGINLKSAIGWNSFGNGTNDFGFSVLPGGNINIPEFNSIGNSADFGTSTHYNVGNAWMRLFSSEKDNVYRYYFGKSTGRSVRCLKD
jgi:uncharacterized protein (TIGR02145 family)